MGGGDQGKETLRDAGGGWGNRPVGRRGGGWAGEKGGCPRPPASAPTVTLGLPGLLLSAADGADLLLRLLLLPSAGGGRVLQLHAAPSLG